MRFDILFDTNRFNLSEVKPNFINDCCFGEDFAKWLGQELRCKGFNVGQPIQEDWGWCFHILTDDKNYFIGVGGTTNEKNAELNQGQWRVMINRERSLMDKILRKNKMSSNEDIINTIHNILTKEDSFRDITIEPFN